ncbi:M48 family metallopeptidase [Marinimicrobium alkaliphilum]|uniref:M48 family metallopeptidase n=1 Tax=Marinimicrobium alkaliphilum TaxID=2202654 RepID=UPI000DB9B803|nr:M48 family metallopeptidase [Marinimicrobium alkaliphilum]
MNQSPRPHQLDGHWYVANSSTRVPAQMHIMGSEVVQICDVGAHPLARCKGDELRVSPRLGNTPRQVELPGLGIFETRDHATLDAWLSQWQPSRWRGWVHALESRWRFVLLTVIAVIAIGYLTVEYGLPAGANRIAHALPAETLDRVAHEALVIMDRLQFEPSELPESRQAELLASFTPMLERFPELPLRVLFRKGGEGLGPNAMALPDGTMIFTDEMIELAENDDELLAVLAHEIGHVAHRHSLRSVIQNATLGVAYMLIVGDASATADLMASLPIVMATLSYSRQHEWEADAFAAQVLDDMGIERDAFVTLMSRLGEHGHDDDDTGGRWDQYWSTHPDTRERLRAFHDH